MLDDGVTIAERMGLKEGTYLLCFYVIFKDHIKY